MATTPQDRNGKRSEPARDTFGFGEGDVWHDGLWAYVESNSALFSLNASPSDLNAMDRIAS